MANVIHRTTYEIRESVNTPDFPSATWLTWTDADVAGLSAVPRKYWKVDGESVVERTEAEKTTVEIPAALAAVDNRTRSLALADLDATYDTANGNTGATAKTAITAAKTLAELETAKSLDGR